jgi:hypothetical protein
MGPTLISLALMRDADAAMFLAKRQRRPYATFDDGMRLRAADRLRLANDLHRALDRRELEVHHQPLVRLEDRRIVGAEALLRWTHSTRGPVSPAEFIPLAEESGLIVPIGEWVLREACERAAEWRALPGHEDFELTVNLSARQLANADLVEFVAGCSSAPARVPTRWPSSSPETFLLEQSANTAAVLGQLEALGGRAPARRLRDGLLVAEPPAALPPRRDQDRPLVRERARQDRARRRHHRRARRDGRRARPARHRRGRRDGGARRAPARARVRVGAGLPVRAAVPARRVLGAARRGAVRAPRPRPLTVLRHHRGRESAADLAPHRL